MFTTKFLTFFAAFLIISLSCIIVLTPSTRPTYALNPVISEMIAKMNETEIYDTVYHLSQVIGPRYYGTAGNTQAATYLYDRLRNLSARLAVEYQGEYKNVIGTLHANSSRIYVIGAHYDTVANCPGATDNAGGCAIVLEIARIMCQYNFTYTVKFAFWNREEGWNPTGATDYVQKAAQNTSLYFNYDSSCYDPDNHFILDIMYNSKSAPIKDKMTEHNTQYDIGFSLTYNVHTCTSDHIPFWNAGYVAAMTHSETHGTMYHTPSDTVERISTAYAKKNAQLGMSVIARLSEVVSFYRNPDVNGDGIVDMKDIGICCQAYGSDPTSPRWNPNVDINDDGIVDMKDIGVIVKSFGSIM